MQGLFLSPSPSFRLKTRPRGRSRRPQSSGSFSRSRRGLRGYAILLMLSVDAEAHHELRRVRYRGDVGRKSWTDSAAGVTIAVVLGPHLGVCGRSAGIARAQRHDPRRWPTA